MLFEDTYRHQGMRRSLLVSLQEKGITDKQVLEAMMNVPRHYFMDSAFIEHAYQDKAFGIGEGQTISQPFTVAYQTQLLKVAPKQKILEIGTGSGYQSSVLANLDAFVYTIEVQKKLYIKTKHLLKELNVPVNTYCGDGTLGLAVSSPYDRILVTAGSPQIPPTLLGQLKENGILVIPVGSSKNQKMMRITRLSKGEYRKEVFDNFSFVPLIGKEGWKV